MTIIVTEQQKADLLEALKEEYGVTDLADDLVRMQLKYLLPDGTFIGGNAYRTHNWAFNIPLFNDICNKNHIPTPYRSDTVASMLEAVAGTIQLTQTARSYHFMVHGNVRPTEEQLLAIEGLYQTNKAMGDDRPFRLSASGFKKDLPSDEVTADAVKSAFGEISPKVARAR